MKLIKKFKWFQKIDIFESRNKQRQKIWKQMKLFVNIQSPSHFPFFDSFHRILVFILLYSISIICIFEILFLFIEPIKE
jgi:hypothetical protein